MKDVFGTWSPIFHLPPTEDPAYYKATDLNTPQLVPSLPSKCRLLTSTLHNWYHHSLQNAGFLPQLSRISTIIVFQMQACLHPPKTITRPLKIKDSEQQNQISIRQSYTLTWLPLEHNHLFMKEFIPCLKSLMREKIRGSQLADINEAFSLVFFCVLGNFDFSDITNTGLG